MFTFKNDAEVETLIKLLELNAPMFGNERATLRDPFRYRSLRGQYLAMLNESSTYFEALKSRRPRIDAAPASGHRDALPLIISLIHILEVPMIDLPLYINTRYRIVRDTAKWRLMRCP